MTSQATSDSKWHAQAATTIRTLLSEILTPDLYRRNPFRMLGLPTTASTRAIATHVQKRQVLAELGSTDASLDGPFPVRPPPSLEEIRNAERELHDPVRRIIHELFWFWPLDGVDGSKDPGFLTLKAGDVPGASKIWTQAAANPATAPIARHNNAVRWHLTALGLEKQSHKLKDNDQARERYLRYWKGALGLWDETFGNDVTWAALSARALTLDDDRISLEFIQELRAHIAEAFIAINAGLVAKYVTEGRADLAKIQVSLVLADKLKAIHANVFANTAVTQLKGNLRAFLHANDPGIEGHETAGAEVATALVGVLGAYCLCFEELESAAADDSWRDTVDEVIRKANLYAVAYVNKTADNSRFANILRSAVAFVSQNDLFVLLDGNIKDAIGRAAGAHLQPYFDLLKEALESKDPPKKRIDLLQANVISHVPQIREKLKEIGHPIDEFTNSIAVVLRSISVDAWNTNKDGATASTALDLADQFVIDKELAEKIKADRATLKDLVKTAEWQRKDRIARRAWGAAAVIAIVCVIAYLGFNNQGGNTNSAAPASADVPTPAIDAPSATPAAATDAGTPGTFLVPHSHDAELEQDRQQVESAQAETRRLNNQVQAANRLLESKQADAEAVKTQADLLSRTIEAQRPVIQDSDTGAVDGFNASVQHYNQLIIRLRHLNADANKQVEVYNALVDQAHEQTDASNRLVDAYNAKLARYGTQQ